MSMETLSPRIRTLLRQADRVAEANKRAAAAKLYRDILKEAPDTAAAWAGLAKVLADPDERQKALDRAVELDPELAVEQEEQEETGTEEAPGKNSDAPDKSPTVAKAGRQETVASNAARNGMATSSRQTADRSRLDQSSVKEEAVGDHGHEAVLAPEELFCTNHPRRVTNLRCNRCGKPICSKCAITTPVGYRCPQCIREHEDVYYSADPVHYAVALTVSFPLSLIAGWIATFLGFWVIFLAAFAGSVIGRIAFWAVGRRRGRWLPHLVAGTIVLGAALVALILFMAGPSLRLIWIALYAVIAYGSAYYQMK